MPPAHPPARRSAVPPTRRPAIPPARPPASPPAGPPTHIRKLFLRGKKLYFSKGLEIGGRF